MTYQTKAKYDLMTISWKPLRMLGRKEGGQWQLRCRLSYLLAAKMIEMTRVLAWEGKVQFQGRGKERLVWQREEMMGKIRKAISSP